MRGGEWKMYNANIAAIWLPQQKHWEYEKKKWLMYWQLYGERKMKRHIFEIIGNQQLLNAPSVYLWIFLLYVPAQ